MRIHVYEFQQGELIPSGLIARAHPTRTLTAKIR